MEHRQHPDLVTPVHGASPVYLRFLKLVSNSNRDNDLHELRDPAIGAFSNSLKSIVRMMDSLHINNRSGSAVIKNNINIFFILLTQ